MATTGLIDFPKGRLTPHKRSGDDKPLTISSRRPRPQGAFRSPPVDQRRKMEKLYEDDG